MVVQVKHLLGEIEKIATDTFPKNIHVKKVAPQGLWAVLGDPTQLHQVLLNLCVNARDAMPNGGTLAIAAENRTLDTHYAGLIWNVEAKAGPYICLQVTDSGTGMPPELIEKIFDPFFTTKELGKGTGLGLSTSMAILKSHGGFVQVQSELGKGTKFSVYLPAQTETSPDEAVIQAAEMPRGDGELILVVDDELTVRDITQQTLEVFGYRVVLATNGVEAVAIYARQGPEIAAVITDMMMPLMDGPATILVLRGLNPAVRIIGTSGLAVTGQAASLNIAELLPKPFTAETLLKALKQVLAAPALG
jgi:CheY-like chemotaxis protein